MKTVQSTRVLVTGGAGLVGQNLMLLMRETGYVNLVVIDKQSANPRLLAHLNPSVRVVDADLAERGAWEDEFVGAETAVVLHAQITGKTLASFDRNNIAASDLVFRAIARAKVPFSVHVRSSVVNSVADDDYTKTIELSVNHDNR
jgi:nucleoside-diphosphate-sugar epimerase